MSRRKTSSSELQEKSALGARIRDARKRAGMRQEDLGKAVGVGKSHVSEWERGTYTPHADTIRRIAGATGCDLAWLLRGDEDRPGPKVEESARAYTTPEVVEIVEAVREILASGQETIISALRQNIRAFLVAARALAGSEMHARRNRRKEKRGDPDR